MKNNNVTCGLCGEINKIISINKYLYNEYCNKCGNTLIFGLYGHKIAYEEYIKSDHWGFNEKP